jgi:hypothetical protein
MGLRLNREATHDDVRLAVDAPSGGFIDAACFRVR